MKKFFLTLWAAILLTGVSVAQNVDDSSAVKTKKKDWSKINLGDRANDHFMIQFGSESMLGLPDTIKTRGIGKHLNIYLMFDKPFKTDPRFSVGIGVGIGSSNIMYRNTIIDLKGAVNPGRATFINVENQQRFKKYKMTTAWAEVPVELRFASNPLNTNKGWKAAIGVKVGTMLSAHTKGKNLLNAAGQSIYGNRFIEKEKDRKFLNGTRFAGTARIGLGNFSIYSAIQITSLFKDGQGPVDLRPFSLGLCISGL
jgi:hypothetical protein